MEKILLTFAVLLSVKIVGYAQGTVLFNNNSASLISTNLVGNAGPARIGSFLVALYGGGATATEGELVQLGAPTVITNTAGRFFGGNFTA